MRHILLAGACALAVAGAHAAADDRASAHAPIGVMGDHVHAKGEFMLSYRTMRMDMSGALIGTDSVSPETIATTIANTNAPPPTLRVVPTSMTMDMHMFGLMWAPSDRVTLMAMAPYVVKEMDHVTFQGGMGTTRLGAFRVETDGVGDVKLSALVKLHGAGDERLVANLGLSLPTGSIDETHRVLAPTGATPTLTVPYAMQLGSGSVDPFASVTWARGGDGWGWGAQGSALLRVADNDADYRFGDEWRGTAWASYAFAPSASASLRLAASSIGAIEGRDARIAAPVQTADPAFYGGERIDVGVGLNLAGQRGAIAGHRLAFEVSAPVYQDLNGPQMETDVTATIGWQYAWGG